MIIFDTDTCIEILRGNITVIEKRKEYEGTIGISFMSVAELYYGAEKSGNYSKNNKLIEEFLFTIKIIDTNIEIMKKYGQLKRKQELLGFAVADADLFIAATTICSGDKLITGNIKHFIRIEELTIEDWIR